MSHLYHVAMRTYPKVRTNLNSLKLLLNTADKLHLPINSVIIHDVSRCRLLDSYLYVYPLAIKYRWHAGHELKLLCNYYDEGSNNLTAHEALKVIKKKNGYIDYYNGVPIHAQFLDTKGRSLHLLPYLLFDDRLNDDGALFTQLIKACIFYTKRMK